MSYNELESPEVQDQAILELQARQDASSQAGVFAGTGATVPITQGGTGSTTAAGARSNLGAAPNDATFITQTANAELTNEQALSALATGYVKVTTATGVLSSQAVPIPVTDGGTAVATLTGLASGNGASAFVGRTITAASSSIVVTNGNGATANPTVDTAQNIQTSANPTFAGVVSSTSGRFALKVATPSQITSNQNDYNPGAGGWFRLSSDAARNITGILAGADGDIIWLANVGANNIVLQNQNVGSSSANRIITGTGSDVTIVADDTAILLYDLTSTKWRLFA